MSFPNYAEYKDSGVEWLGEVPEHWGIQKLKRIATFSGGGTPSRDNLAFWNGDIPWISPKDMKSEEITTAEECITTLGLHSSTTNIVKPNTVIIVVRSGILRHTIPVAITKTEVALNQDMKAIHLDAGSCLAKFFLRWVQGLNGHLLLSWGKQGATVESIEHEYLSNSIFPLPSIKEQSAIAAFLDRETAKIDALVAEQEKLIELLKEKRQAVISHAVTKGLEPNVPMKDSGLEWMGEVPEHWSTGYIKKFAHLESGHTPSRQHPEYWENCTIPWFSLSDVWQIRDGLSRYVSETTERVSHLGLANSSARLLPKGTVILSRTASVGFSAIMGCDMATTQDFANWICKENLIPEFLLYVFKGMKSEFDRLMMGSTHKTIYMPDISKFAMGLPPIPEQISIINFLDQETQKAEKLIEESQRAIDLLKERRSVLISAAVTGKIDVRGLAEATQ